MPRSWPWARAISRGPRPSPPSTGSRARTAPTRSCSRSRGRCGLHPAAELDARAVVGAGAGGRQARAVREAAVARDPARWSEAFDAAERAGRVLMEAFMWRFHPQTERARAARARRRDRRRCASSARRSASTCAARRTCAGRAARGRRADGRRLLLRQRAAAPVRRAGAGERRAGARRRRASTPASPACCASPATCSARSTAAWTCTAATRSRSSAPRARSSSRPVADAAPAPRSSWRDGEPERDHDPRPSIPTGASSRRSAARSPAASRPGLGRDDALGQARTIEALYRAAADRHRGQPLRGRAAASRSLRDPTCALRKVFMPKRTGMP